MWQTWQILLFDKFVRKIDFNTEYAFQNILFRLIINKHFFVR